MPIASGTSTGGYVKWLNKVQGGDDNTRTLLMRKLAASDKTVSPTAAATDVMKGQLAEIKKDTANKFFTDLTNRIKENEKEVEMTGPSTPTNEGRAKQLQNSSLADNPANAMKIAGELLTQDATLQQDLALSIHGKLWEDTAKANPNAGPKELAEAYDNNLKALAKQANQIDPMLSEKLRLDAPAVDLNITKSMADTFRELADAAEKLDPNTTIAKLNTKINELTTASDLIATDIDNLKQKLDDKSSEYEKDIAKRSVLQIKLEKLQDAQLDLIGGTDLKSGGVIDRIDSIMIGALEKQRTALRKEIATNGSNPKKNEALPKVINEANAAIAKIDGSAPLGDRATQSRASKIDNLGEITAGYPELKAVCTAYAENVSTGGVLQTFANNVDQLNEATKVLRDLSEKLVTPAAMEAYKTEYQIAVKQVDTCCAAIARQLSEEAARDLIETAFIALDKKGALKDLTTRLSNLNESATDLRREVDESTLPKVAARRVGKERPAIEPLGEDSLSMKAATMLGSERLQKMAEERDASNRKEHAEALQQYYTFSHKVYDKSTGKYSDEPIKDSSGKPINLSYEEAEGLVAKWNAEHPNQKPPVTIKKKGNGYYIECHSSETKREFIETMKAFQDEKNKKLENETTVTEKNVASGPAIEEKNIEKPLTATPATATGVVTAAAPESTTELPTTPSGPGASKS